MVILESSKRLEWGDLDLPLSGILTDWHRNPLSPPAAFSLAQDGENLWFIAGREAPAMIHPSAIPGDFTESLWKHDVAELFITHPDEDTYLEFNLAANGAWWASAFSSARQPISTQPDFQNYIMSYHDENQEGGWLAALSVPLGFLKKEISFGSGSRANVTFILNSPTQTFHSASKLPGVEPDFHQPAAMPVLTSAPSES